MITALLMVTEEMNLCVFYCKLSLFRNKIFLTYEIHHFGNASVDTVYMKKRNVSESFLSQSCFKTYLAELQCGCQGD